MVIREDSDRIDDVLDVGGHRTMAEIRMALLVQWGNEKPHTKHRYFVRTFADGNRLYIDRPARINKGCDFIVHLENQFLCKNGNDRPPSHGDLWSDLESKQSELSDSNWLSLCRAIARVHSLQPIELSESARQSIDEKSGMSAEKILCLCEWLFIEQDLTYWHGEGRDRLYNELKTLPEFDRALD